MAEPPAAPKSTITRAEWVLLLVLAAVQFTNILDFVIVMPLAPLAKEDLHITSNQFGHIVGAYGFAACIGSLLAAKFLDRFGRKTALLLLYAGFAISTLGCGLAPTYEWLVAARAVAGLFGGVAGAAVIAIVSDVFADYRRATAMGVVMSSFAVASIVGVPIGLFLAENFGTGAPFTAIALGCIVVWVAALIVLPPLHGHRSNHPHPSLFRLATEPRHLTAFAFTISIVLSGFMIIPFIADSMVANAGQRKENIKWVYLCGGLFTFVSTIAVGRLADRHGKRLVFRIMASAACVMGLIVTNLPPVPLWVAMLVATGFMVAMSGRMVPSQALIAGSAQPAVRGGFLSLNGAVQYMGMGLASALSGALVGQSDDGRLPGYPLIGALSAGVALISLLLAGYLRSAEPMPKNKPETTLEPATG